jgi:hypothetical protein
MEPENLYPPEGKSLKGKEKAPPVMSGGFQFAEGQGKQPKLCTINE